MRRILLAVSGGIDSMYMANRAPELFPGAVFSVAHCNFRLRGGESDGDEAFVRSWCADRGIECFVESFDTRAYAAAHGVSIEMAARELRYAWFAGLCREKGFEAVAVASQFDGDGQLTSALNYVTSTKEYKAYYTSGHGESSLSSEVTSLLTKSRISTSDLLLMTATSIPDDCNLLIIDGATSDFTKDEVKLLSSYLKKGGKVVTLLAQTNKSMKNLYGLLKDYGLTVQSGYIADTERSYQGNYYYLIPNLSVSGDMASGISSNSVMMINSKGMTQSTPVRDSISTDAFMTTSSNGYAVTEKKQTQGTYVLGATSTESVKVKNSKGKKVTKESRLTVYGSNMLIDEQITSSFSSLENLTLFTNSVTACLNNADNVSISPKSLEVSYNTIAHPGPFSILVVFVIPVGLIIGGFIVWFRRRRR